ncbi:MAG: Ppx/GppA family phosphatase [Alphaproteobacteria bacterium]|nr:Ppx/GppA family phosphatase [Alphaproteobacteria bacterium]
MLFTRRFNSAERVEITTGPPVGVIDIGSNSVRLVIYEGAVRAPTPYFNEKELCGLGRRVASTGRLGKCAIDCALRALKRFRAIADALNVGDLKVIATAAVRDAEDGGKFIAIAEKVCRVDIQVLTGQEEARIAAQGVLMGVPDADGIVADMGGGSVELVDVKSGDVRNAITLPLGGLRLIDMSGGRIEKAEELIDAALAGVPWLKDAGGRTFYAVGGTWRAVAKMHMAGSDYPLNVMHEYDLDATEALTYTEKIRRSKRFAALPGSSAISKQRREVVPFGALLMERLLLKMKPKSVQFSVFGVREGIFYSLLDEDERAKDPLLSYCRRLAELYSRSPYHGEELCHWTDGLFRHPELTETDEERRLRYAACLISDIGWRAHPDYRGEHSLDAVAHSALSGIDHPGRTFLALSIYFRHASRGEEEGEKLSSRLKKAASKRALRRAKIVGAAVRAAHMLSVGMAGKINQTSLAYENGVLVWSIPTAISDLDGARLRRRFETLAHLVGCIPQVRIF